MQEPETDMVGAVAEMSKERRSCAAGCSICAIASPVRKFCATPGQLATFAIYLRFLSTGRAEMCRGRAAFPSQSLGRGRPADRERPGAALHARYQLDPAPHLSLPAVVGRRVSPL